MPVSVFEVSIRFKIVVADIKLSEPIASIVSIAVISHRGSLFRSSIADFLPALTTGVLPEPLDRRRTSPAPPLSPAPPPEEMAKLVDNLNLFHEMWCYVNPTFWYKGDARFDFLDEDDDGGNIFPIL
ncbi:hypothetical protein KSP40_PGU015004 [Platanthera guangdongensis]|uniref:Uncharacterized protein n=1 Tax=Platanthera guangdongensis TaxID=2320717 RepID=A0ABR2MAT1_9ASPA